MSKQKIKELEREEQKLLSRMVQLTPEEQRKLLIIRAEIFKLLEKDAK